MPGLTIQIFKRVIHGTKFIDPGFRPEETLPAKFTMPPVFKVIEHPGMLPWL
jgi:hypothetical protein